MKEIIVTKMVEQTTHTYESNDGLVFDNERECIQHEESLNRKAAIAKFDSIPHYHYNFSILEGFGEFQVNAYFLKDISDFDAVCIHYNECSSEFDVRRGENFVYPCAMVVCTDDAYSWIAKAGVEESADMARNDVDSADEIEYAYHQWIKEVK